MDDCSSTLRTINFEGHDEGDTSPNGLTSAFSRAGELKKITTEEAAELLGLDVTVLTPESFSEKYKESWNTANKPDSINVTLTKQEEEIAQLQIEVEKLMASRKLKASRAEIIISSKPIMLLALISGFLLL